MPTSHADETWAKDKTIPIKDGCLLARKALGIWIVAHQVWKSLQRADRQRAAYFAERYPWITDPP